MEFLIRTLTPLWAAGVESGQQDRLHETGIIGSLRWWYEAVLRGLGADVCNPTAPIRRSAAHAMTKAPHVKHAPCSVAQVVAAVSD